jgi:phosphoglycolate phosphatase
MKKIVGIGAGIDTVIWDWNGTVMDDVDVCLSAINEIMRRRRLPAIDMTRYRSVFCFPIESYYRALGFDFARESFHEVGREYHAEYEKRWAECQLQPGVGEVLNFFEKAGVSQFVLSAAESSMLRRWMNHFGLGGFFSDVAGLDNIYAVSKVAAGRELMARAGVEPSRAVMVGDTSHDAEVARELGVKPILVARGHESLERLQTTGELVLGSYQELLQLVRTA